MKRRKNKAFKQKISRLTHRAGEQRIFHVPDILRKFFGYCFILFAVVIIIFPLWSLFSLAIGLLFLRGPVYTERKVLRVVHTVRRVKSIVSRYLFGPK